MAAPGSGSATRRDPDWGDSVALLIVAGSSRDPDLAPLVGEAHLGESFVLWPRQDQPRLGFFTAMEREEAAATGLELLGPEELGVRELLEENGAAAEFLSDWLERALLRCGVEPGRVGLAGHGAAGDLVEACARLGEKGWSFVSASRTVRLLRKAKTEPELADAAAAARATTAAFRRIAQLLAAGFRGDGEPLTDAEGAITAGRVRAAAAALFGRHGLEQPEGNIVAAAREAGIPHSRGASERPIRAGEALVVDLFPRRRLFADATRTFCVGRPPAGLAAAWSETAEALGAARRAARPGVTGWELQRLVCERFEAADHPTPISSPGTESGYVHGLGHGVGYELHELPSFRRDAGAEGVLAAGDLITLEPGLYYPDRGWGVRLEDLYRVGHDGLVNLTPLPYELDPRHWS